MGLDVVRGEAVELGGRCHFDAAHVVADVPVELLADQHQLIAQRLDPLPCRGVLVHAREAEVPQDPADVVPGGRIGASHLHGLDRVEHAAVERDVGGERRHPLAAPLGGLPQSRIRMDFADQAGLARGPVQLPHQVVVGHQGIGDRPLARHPHQAVEERPSPAEPGVHCALERGRVGLPGPERLVVRVGWIDRSSERGGECQVSKRHGVESG